MVRVVIIKNIDELIKYIKVIKDDSRVNKKFGINVVGFDVEMICKDNFNKTWENCRWVENKKSVVPCTVQISTNNICLIICLKEIGVPLPKKLKNIITSETWIKCGVGTELDLKILSDSYNLGHCGGCYDMKSISIIGGCETPNLENLYSTFVYPKKKQKHLFHDWSSPLDDITIKYACMDAVMSYRLFHQIFIPSIKNIQTKVENKETGNISFDDTIEYIDNEIGETVNRNYIGELQHTCQKMKIHLPVYFDLCKSGSDFVFKCCIFSNSENIVSYDTAEIETMKTFYFYGRGKTKKYAKHESAKLAFNFIKNNDTLFTQ